MRHLRHTGLDPLAGIDPRYIDPKNYADNAVLLNRFAKLRAVIEQVKIQRAGLEEDWVEAYLCHQQKNGATSRVYRGLNDVYLPTVWANVETAVEHIKSEIFPTNNAFAVKPNPTDLVAAFAAPLVAMMMQHFIEQARIKQELDVSLRQGVLYGMSPIEATWEVVTTTNYKRKLMKGAGKQLAVTVEPEEVVLFEGPTFNFVDLFDFYVHPIAERRPERWSLVTRLRDVSETDLLDMQDRGIYMNVDKALERASGNERDAEQSQGIKDDRLSIFGLSGDSVNDKPLTIHEVYALFPLYENERRVVPCRITFLGNTVLEIRQNPFWNQQHPYLVWRDTDIQEHAYGRGRVQSARWLQYAQNGVFNQGLDSNAFASNMMMGIDAVSYQGRIDDIFIEPRMIFPFMGDPAKGLRFYAPPNTVGQAAQISQALGSAIMDAMRTNPMMQGRYTSQETTATKDALVAQGAQTAIASGAGNYNTSIMSQWMDRAYQLAQQFLSLTGRQRMGNGLPFEMDPTMLVGGVRFDWLLGSEAQQFMQQQAAQTAAMAEAGMKGAPFASNHPGAQQGGELTQHEGAVPNVGPDSGFNGD